MQTLIDALAAFEVFLTGAVASPWMPALLFAVCVVDGFFPPVPSEIVLLAAAATTWVTAPQAIFVVVLAATAGAWVGDNGAYAIGRRLGPTPVPWMRGPRVRAVTDRVGGEIHARPESVLLTARFIPVARVVATMAAGAARLPYRRFVMISLVSAAAWACVSTATAIAVGSFLASSPLLTTFVTIVAAVALGIVVDRLLTRRRALLHDASPLETEHT